MKYIQFGYRTVGLKDESLLYRMIETVMKSEYFDGLSQIGKEDRENILRVLCKYNCHEYLKLILKYIDKNKSVIENGINFIDRSKDSCLSIVIKNEECDATMFDLLFEASRVSNVKIDAKIIDHALTLCQSDNNLFDKWNDLIKQHFV